MLGLMYGTVQVVEWDPQWQILFDQERALLQSAIGHLVLDVQHVGSTSVPHLPSKPILDIAAAVESFRDIENMKEALVAQGYLYRRPESEGRGHLFVKESEPKIRTHHLHLVLKNGREWSDYLKFRNLLKANTELRVQYEDLKRNLQAQFADSRGNYTDGKSGFIRRLLGR